RPRTPGSSPPFSRSVCPERTSRRPSMAFRIKIPFVLDLAIVRDNAEMTRLNNESAVVRHVSGRGGLFHRLIRARIESLPVGGGLLPALERRDNPARQAAQQETDATLTHLAQEAQPF